MWPSFIFIGWVCLALDTLLYYAVRSKGWGPHTGSVDARHLVKWSPKSRVWLGHSLAFSFSCVLMNNLPSQGLSTQVQPFCACSSFWKVSLSPSHFYAVFLFCVGDVFAKEDFSSSSSSALSLSPAFSPAPRAPQDTRRASIASVCRYLIELVIPHHNYSADVSS